MSYEIIEKNEYGVLVNNEEIYNVCFHCKYDKSNIQECYKMCGSDTEYYYLPDQEAAKLETEITTETFTINDMYVESKLLFDCQDELKDLQIENKKLKERIEELEYENTTELSENQIAELAQIGSQYLYLGATEECRISYGGIIEILKRYNEICTKTSARIVVGKL